MKHIHVARILLFIVLLMPSNTTIRLASHQPPVYPNLTQQNKIPRTWTGTCHVRSRKNANIRSRRIRLDVESSAVRGGCVAGAVGKSLTPALLRAGIIAVVCLDGGRAIVRPHGECGATPRTACCWRSHRSGSIFSRRDHKWHSDGVRLRAAGGYAIMQAISDKPVCAKETDN